MAARPDSQALQAAARDSFGLPALAPAAQAEFRAAGGFCALHTWLPQRFTRPAYRPGRAMPRASGSPAAVTFWPTPGLTVDASARGPPSPRSSPSASGKPRCLWPCESRLTRECGERWTGGGGPPEKRSCPLFS
jgi:hypothetical protein